jgi:hypothetical protein
MTVTEQIHNLRLSPDNCFSSWNTGEASQLLNRREWILLKGIKNCLINNDRRWFLGVSIRIVVDYL